MNTRMQEAARRYISSDFVAIPVPAGRKNPGRRGWEALRISEDEIPKYWTNGQNVGVLLGEPSGWRVDVDLDADEAVKIAGRFLPPTLTSGRGERPHSHWWYVSEGAASTDWRGPDGKKLVEVRSNGRQTLVAPSTHPSGDAYMWHSGLEVEKIPPDELASRCRELATAALIARYVPPEGSRHDFAMALAGLLLRPGRLDKETTLKVLLAGWHAAAADSREATRDLEGIVRDTARNLGDGRPVVGGPTLEESAPGLARVLGRWWGWSAANIEATVWGQKDEQTAETFTAADLLATELPPVRWAVPGVLPEGVTILAGKPKLGKSWLALGLCVAVASGGKALGSIQVERGEALYLALEDNRRRLQRRLCMLLGDGPAPEGLHLRLHSERLDQGGAEALGVWLAGHPGCRLVVIDTLKKVRPKEAGRRAVYDSDYEALEPLLPVAAEHGVSILVVHHLRKMDADDPLDAISGSTGLTGGVDGTLILARERGQADAYLHIDGRDVEEPRELALRWDRNVASWTVVGDAEDFRLSEIRREIRDLLENADGPMSARDVAIGIGKGYEAVRQRLYQMSRDGEVKVVARGKYTCVTSSHNKRNSVTNTIEKGADVTAVVTRLDDRRNNGHGDKPIDESIVMDVMADDKTSNDSPHAAGMVVTRPEGVRSNTTNPLSVEQILAELERPGSGPQKALKTYLEKPGESRIMYLVKAVLHSRGMDLVEWDHHRDAVRRAIEEIGD